MPVPKDKVDVGDEYQFTVPVLTALKLVVSLAQITCCDPGVVLVGAAGVIQGIAQQLPPLETLIVVFAQQPNCKNCERIVPPVCCVK